MSDQLSILDRLAEAAPEQRRAWIYREALRCGVTVEEVGRWILTMWRYRARPKQLQPDGDWTFWFLMSGRGFGKEACVETPVATVDGWKRLGDIDVGDLVFDESGRPCPVLETFDSVPEEAYRLWFSDGTHLDVGADHLWVTWDRAARKAYNRSPYEDQPLPPEWPAWRLRRLPGKDYVAQDRVEEALALIGAGASTGEAGKTLGISYGALLRHVEAGAYVIREPRCYDDSPGPQTRSTRQIVETLTQGGRGDRNHSIPVCGSLDLPERDLPLDPYILGAWLGDGSSYSGALTSGLEDQPHWYRALARFSPHPVTDPLCVAMFGLTTILRGMGLIQNKHVPPRYLRASRAQRLALLQGLMDTDGSAEASKVEFSNSNRRLVEAVVELARSLGQKPVVYERNAYLNGKDCGLSWRISWRPTIPVFRLERKAGRVRDLGAQATRNYHRMIVGAERIVPKPMRCLTVGSRHHMFLLGEAMIPTHNTLSAAEWVAERGREQKCRIAVVAPTFADVRGTCFEGDTGLLRVFQPHELMGGNRQIAYNESLFELTLANGTTFKGYSAETPNRLRGPQFQYAWLEEVSSFPDAHKGDVMETTWSNLKLALRLGTHPRAVLTSTPKANKLTRHLVGLDSLALVRGSSYENRDNLSEVWWQTVVAPMEGTRTGRQEIQAELLEDVEGALWSMSDIDASRTYILPGTKLQARPGWQKDPELRDAVGARMRRIVVGVDPNTTSGESADAAGVIVVAEGEDGHGYVLDDRTVVRGGPSVWRAVAIDAFHDWAADKIIAESNNGGEMVDLVLKGFDPTVPVELVTASRGKRTRAEPVAAKYSSDVEHDHEATIHHVGTFPELEEELTTWTPADESPNRLDACVWGMWKLRIWQPPAPSQSGVAKGDIPGIVEVGAGLLDSY